MSRSNILTFAQKMEFTSTELDGNKYYGATPTSTGTYLVFATFLYRNWKEFYIGVIQIYNNNGTIEKYLSDLHAKGVTATLDNDANISFSHQPSSMKYLRIGYWNSQAY